MKLHRTLAAAILLAVVSTATIGQQLKVATGGSAGTYSTMLKQIIGVCGTSIAIVEQNSTGAVENLNLLTGNQVNAAFMQTDVLYFSARTQDLGNIKTLVALHPEEVHLLAPATSMLKEGGMLGVGSKPVVLATIKDLQGRRVGAAGGSLITAQVLRLQGEIGFNVLEYPDNNALIAALGKGEVDTGVFVGGAPLPILAGLKGDWKFLSIPEDVVAKLKSVYRPARLNYSSLKQMGITTVATDALFVTREYKTAKFLEALGALRSCIVKNLDDLKETTGMHPKWQAVDIANQGKWPYYELPTAVAAKK